MPLGVCGAKRDSLNSEREKFGDAGTGAKCHVTETPFLSTSSIQGESVQCQQMQMEVHPILFRSVNTTINLDHSEHTILR